MRTRLAASPKTVDDPDRALPHLLSYSRQGLTRDSKAVHAEARPSQRTEARAIVPARVSNCLSR